MADLYPTVDKLQADVDKIVWGVCKRFGYGVDSDGGPVAGAWDDSVAMWNFYEEKLFEFLTQIYGVEKDRAEKAGLPTPEDYAGEIT